MRLTLRGDEPPPEIPQRRIWPWIALAVAIAVVLGGLVATLR